MKRVGFSCLLLVLMSAAACGGGSDGKKASPDKGSSSSQRSSSQPVTANVVSKKAGFADGSIYAYLENRENREIAIEPGFVAYNAAGGKLDENETTPSSSYYLLPPHSTTFIATSVNDTTVTRVEAKPQVATDAEIPKHGSGSFGVARIDLSGMPLQAHVPITNHYQQNVSGAELSVICKDAAGKPITIAPPREFDVPKNAAVTVDIPVGDSPIKACEAFPHIVAKTLFS